MLSKKRKSLSIAFSTAWLLIVLIAVSLSSYLLFNQDPFSPNILTLSIGLGVIFSLALYFWLNRQINKLLDAHLKELFKDFSAENEVLYQANEVIDLKELEKRVKEIVSKRKLEITTLKSQDAFRKEFLGNVAHELKTPLFTVQGYLSTLSDGALYDEKVNKKYITRASKGVNRLLYIVKDLDLLTQLETQNQALVISNFDIVEHVRNIFELLEIRAAKANISLEFDKDYLFPIEVHADEKRIQQVVTNLIVNSIKYGKEKGQQKFVLKTLIKHNQVHIADNGEESRSICHACSSVFR